MFKELEITGTQIGLFFLLFVALTIGIILYFKNKYKKYKYEDLAKNNELGPKDKSVSSMKKYPQVDVFKNSGAFFNFGLTLAVALSLITISWTQYEKAVFIPDGALDLEEEVEVDIPRTAEPPPPPPPPPPPVVQEIPDTEIIEEEQPTFTNTDITEETVIEPVVQKAAPPPPPPPPPPKPAEEEIVKFAEQMPRFPGCEDKATEEEKKKCANELMLKYIYSNLKYPAIAKENNVEGQVVIQFVVEKDGSIGDVKTVRDIGAGCGDAAAAVVKGMNNLGKKWTPGKQQGRPVRVYYTLPVKFKLE